ncbi:hypothetical protein Hanom_Chr01g00089991 [Helianthus anomalus]
MTWAKVKCRLQPNGWECGYCVMLAMYDFVIRNREHMVSIFIHSYLYTFKNNVY